MVHISTSKGERQVAQHLQKHGYTETIHTYCSAWYPPK